MGRLTLIFSERKLLLLLFFICVSQIKQKKVQVTERDRERNETKRDVEIWTKEVERLKDEFLIEAAVI